MLNSWWSLKSQILFWLNLIVMIFPYIMKVFFFFKKSPLHIFSQWLLSNSLDRACEMGRHVKALTTRPNNEFHTRDWHGVGREPTSTCCRCRLFDHTVTPRDWVNKVNLESGDRPSNWQTGIGHREPRNMDREDAMEGAEKDLENLNLMNLENIEKRSADHSSATFFMYQVFTPIFDSQVLDKTHQVASDLHTHHRHTNTPHSPNMNTHTTHK